jgi:dihydroorotate dehydrogenase (fumarate)
VVLHSLFEEQISYAMDATIHQMEALAPEFADILARFPSPSDYPLAPDAYAEHVYRVKQAVHIPVIASLNGTSAQPWLKFAKIIEQAGADAVELNLYNVVTDLSVPAVAAEAHFAHLVKELKRIVAIPVAVKLSPFFTSFGNMARQLDAAGADALVLFNRFYQPDIDVKTMDVAAPDLQLSTSAELRLRLRWVAILFGRVRTGLAVTGGVATPDDGIKAILAGADAVQLVSSLLLHGPSHVEQMVKGLERWMAWHKLERLTEVRGRASLERTVDPASLERASYIRTLQSWTH